MERNRLAGDMPPQDLDGLSRGLGPVSPPGERGFFWNHIADPWLNLSWATGYPERVGRRVLQGQFPSLQPETENSRINAALPLMARMSRVGEYQPGERESDMVEDRRPTSIWDYR